MNLLSEAVNGLGAALLQVVAALLFEELTFGGLVRLLVAPWPGTRRRGASNDGRRSVSSSLECRRREHNNNKGEIKCSQ
jgi:hypothetical protein